MFIKPSTKTYVISSPMEGVLMKDGQPLANTKIIRTLTWNDNEDGLTETFTTDDQGRFSLPIHEVDLTLGMLAQFVAKAELSVYSKNDDNIFWYSSKFHAEIFSETNGEIENLTCDINDEEIPVQTDPMPILTKCRWTNMPK
ncbi:MAG: DUF4198 domain-containing protein [Agarilytica sp.]